MDVSHSPSRTALEIAEAIKGGFARIAELYDEVRFGETYETLFKNVVESLQSGRTVREMDHELRIHFLTSPERHPEVPFWMATANFLNAQRLFEVDQLAASQKAVESATFWVEDCSYRPPTRDTILRDASKKGTANRNARFQPLKDEMVRLIKTKRPIEGWKSKAQVVSLIYKEINVLNESLNWVLTSSNLKRKLREWLNTELAIVAAFEETRRR
ncbi:hypothetical protein ABNK63_16230 [Rhodanobacter sp. IGA1.0]|uniref:HEPN AbiU2-like domain-containing protein n=1 Tax=Rhodanobacter sp. IGA1.0 TaxID=3158582 RepID=A0AAU7QMH9_9GAMM